MQITLIDLSRFKVIYGDKVLNAILVCHKTKEEAEAKMKGGAE